MLKNPFSKKNWEADIFRVQIEPCAWEEDPSGYRAVFYVKESKSGRYSRVGDSFAIGASLLEKRSLNLQKAGYSAPMTGKAIDMMQSAQRCA